MTRVLTRTPFHGSRLIRTLADLDVLETDEPSGDFAAQLGLWIDFTGAIALCAVQNSGLGNCLATPSGAQSAARVAIAQDLARMRLSLEQSIKLSCSGKAGKGRIELPTPTPGASVKEAIAYEPYRRFHLAHQRDMELSVRTLRVKVRGQVVQAAPRLKPLVDLDASMHGILCERESRLLATAASLLERRFAQLFKAHQQTLLGGEDKPDTWMQAGAWLGRFCAELETVLLAELDVRLQTTVGLIESLP